MTQVIQAIQEAEKIVLKNGGDISPTSEIIYNGDDEKVLEAIEFLVETCDYSIKKQ